ncbi:hypothetical protein [Bacillus paramycoides]|uniref:hypothetical protein n=1 Tax=Bacillus paramycoides TaxID=2026194 RepID=UPI002E1E6F99|nr:hypothetical protein [Bacillus paramycoides]
MNLILDQALIDGFRGKVNENKLFQQLHKDINGKNSWNIICSAMDWITTTVEGIPSIKLKHTNLGFNAIQSLNLMQYVVSLDLLVESIKKLYKVMDNGVEYPLYYDQSVFNKGINDDVYFKQIRAVFGTHPIDLNTFDGITKNKGERFYASWSATDSLENDDFHVLIYSDDPAKDKQIEFGVSINKINEYAEKRYRLLIELSAKVDTILQSHIDTYKAEVITSVSNPIEQLDILLEENKNRFSETGGYVNQIHYIRRILKTKTSTGFDGDPAIIQGYKDFLLALIPVIKEGLQKMDPNHLDWKITSTGKEFELINNYIYSVMGDHGQRGQKLYERLIEKGILPSYLLTNFEKDEMQLVFDAILHREWSRLSQKVTYEDLLNLAP